MGKGGGKWWGLLLLGDVAPGMCLLVGCELPLRGKAGARVG